MTTATDSKIHPFDLARQAGREPFKVKVRKGDDTLFFDGVVTTANRKQFFQFSYP